MDNRAHLESTGLHLAALAKLKQLGVGAEYTNEQYMAALRLAQELHSGEVYADAVLGETQDDVVEVLDDGRVVRNGLVRS
jgi:hypothetical protein